MLRTDLTLTVLSHEFGQRPDIIDIVARFDVINVFEIAVVDTHPGPVEIGGDPGEMKLVARPEVGVGTLHDMGY